MENTTLAAGEFKATCLKLMDEVAVTGKSITITKRGKPLARLVPVEKTRPGKGFGALAGTVEIHGDIVSSLGIYSDPSAKWMAVNRRAEKHRSAAVSRKTKRKPA